MCASLGGRSGRWSPRALSTPMAHRQNRPALRAHCAPDSTRDISVPLGRVLHGDVGALNAPFMEVSPALAPCSSRRARPWRSRRRQWRLPSRTPRLSRGVRSSDNEPRPQPSTSSRSSQGRRGWRCARTGTASARWSSKPRSTRSHISASSTRRRCARHFSAARPRPVRSPCCAPHTLRSTRCVCRLP